MADWGVKVSKDGTSTTGTADKDLLFTTKNNTLKVSVSRKDTVTSGSTLTIAHGFSYIPIFQVFVKHSSNWVPVSGYTSESAYIDSTNLVITNSIGSSQDFRTIIYVDRI